MTDHIKAARSIWGESAILPLADLGRFWELAHRQGLEDAAAICDRLQDVPATEPRHCAEDIRIHAREQ